MWNTTDGCRVVTGNEAILVRAAAWRLTDDIRTMLSYKHDLPSFVGIGIQAFDDLTPAQQLVMVSRVVALLLDEALPPPSPSAIMDATVAALFRRMHLEVVTEIELAMDPDDDKYKPRDIEDLEDIDMISHRRMIINALAENVAEDEEPYDSLPDEESDDLEMWEMAIDSLRERVLPDMDWQMSEITLDLPPEQAENLKLLMGISSDYFTEIAPEASYEDARTAWTELMRRVSKRKISPTQFDGRHPADANHQTESSEKAKILLHDVIEAVDMMPSEFSSFVNIKTGKVVSVPQELLDVVGEVHDETSCQWGKEFLADAVEVVRDANFRPLPTLFEINEWEVMHDFCKRIANESQRNELLQTIRGNGAFQRFQSAIDRLNLFEQWYVYRAQAIEEVVINWLDAHELPWCRAAPNSRGLFDDEAPF